MISDYIKKKYYAFILDTKKFLIIGMHKNKS